MGYYSATIRKGILTYALVWVNLENILLSEPRSHKRASTVYPRLHEVPGALKLTDRKRDGGCQERREGQWGLVCSGHRVSVVHAEQVLEMDGGDGCTRVNILNTTELHT